MLITTIGMNSEGNWHRLGPSSQPAYVWNVNRVPTVSLQCYLRSLVLSSPLLFLAFTLSSCFVRPSASAQIGIRVSREEQWGWERARCLVVHVVLFLRPEWNWCRNSREFLVNLRQSNLCFAHKIIIGEMGLEVGSTEKAVEMHPQYRFVELEGKTKEAAGGILCKSSMV